MGKREATVAAGSTGDRLVAKIGTIVKAGRKRANENLDWLRGQMHSYFLPAMQEEPAAVAALAAGLQGLGENRRLLLADREKRLIVACLNHPGSLYDTLKTLPERDISFAYFAHSHAKVPGLERELEIQRFDFDRKSNQEIKAAGVPRIPASLKAAVMRELREKYPGSQKKNSERLLGILWLNNENYLRLSPVRRIAQLVWLFEQGNAGGGLFLDVEEPDRSGESRVLFAVGNPPQKDFLQQTMEVFNRLEIGVRRAYCLTITNGTHPYFLGTFFVRRRDGLPLDKGDELFTVLKRELYATQMLATHSPLYRELVTGGLAGGEEAALLSAMIGFCHTNLAHNQPDRFGREDVQGAFLSNPEFALRLIELFRSRFDPSLDNREELYGERLAEASAAIEHYNTGHRHLDEMRRAIFSCALLFIRHTLKTNFFVPAKQALAFRLSPAYLAELGEEFTADLPSAVPFRITFFFGRHGAGYHVGFSDIARGGWRTIVARSRDDYTTCATTLLREVYVLANTQHLKNKDIYEGGSKMVVVLDASDLKSPERELETWRLYKLQYGFINAFLDIFVTKNGRAADPRVIDYYAEDEPIELGPDENMHDSMVEAVASLSVQRGYLLGIGIMSSKKVGINHKEYGVTSTGVVKFAEITMGEIGIDLRRDPFSVKFTGGPNGDVAGNAMRIMLDSCPKAQMRLILDGTAALYDPLGADPRELRGLLMKEDLDRFDPAALHNGGFILYRSQRRTEGLRELYRKLTMGGDGLEEQWVSLDEFSREYDELVFSVEADLFIPAGGRPETIDRDNWKRFFAEDGRPSARVIVEGANSFITPEAREQLQRRGVIVMRDASANKCGVISSSYEIIANLLLTEREFLEVKERYVADVIEILEKRAADEARLILRRRQAPGCGQLYTEISDSISAEINGIYARLFKFFQSRPQLCLQPPFNRVVMSHLPKLFGESPRYQRRLKSLPPKYLYAILAAEIASSLVYRGDQDADFEEMVRGHIVRNF
ncbi:NAD-glutamate dehydrogenase [Geomonas sp. Red32]|uniref:NAD-glutamate dehydrogenase domain-containing protein n=1 Tax=Geomonas sp. Red32 TaxID=2912856 RepID=UPI00202CEA66|nr:NAD-glutamate dehydrogenase domain-containing protein [Geomonas sp. Red32]MCM0080677.1 NAD-glutamate dehydrogenase [Geomonas sp. Red32]